MTAFNTISLKAVGDFWANEFSFTCSEEKATALTKCPKGADQNTCVPKKIDYTYLSCERPGQKLTLFVDRGAYVPGAREKYDMFCTETDKDGLRCFAMENSFAFSLDISTNGALTLTNGHVIANLEDMSGSARLLLEMLSEKYQGWIPSSW